MHKSVLLQETIEMANLQKGDLAIDVTAGAGGHTQALAEAVGKSGRVLSVDRDQEALSLARSIVRGDNTTFAQANFNDLAKVAKDHGFSKVSAIIADLGVSSMQLDQEDRGFSFKKRGVLDMRMDRDQEKSAISVVNEYSEDELVRIFRDYGEERNARACARAIVEARNKRQIEGTDQLAEVVRGVAYVPRGRSGKKIDPATKIFQAVRIEVNDELTSLESTLPQMVSLLKKGGRVAIITFHSLEDRIVKKFFKLAALDCVCPPEFPECKCDKKPTLKIITKKPIVPSEDEVKNNKRARSAKLRVAERV